MSDAITPRNLLRGFLAGALAVFIFHQLTIFVLGQFGLTSGQIYSFQGVPPLGVPRILNAAFWGGLWGVVFALVALRLPLGRTYWLSGFALGCMATLVAWFIVAPIKGNLAAAGWVPTRMMTSIIIHGMFGVGVAVFYAVLDRWLGAGPRAASSAETA
ncbi:MAG: hypothetical protein FJX35_09865 [Alphaproteobacteria bacterium]|nr:hypothetical protein [Alphaproteobacteria bacterium]